MIENTFGINIIPDNEDGRLDVLKRYRISDTPAEDSFDGIAKLAAQIFNVPVSLLSLVDKEDVFFKANFGMGSAKKAKRGTSLCALAILDEKVTVFEDALKEVCLSLNPNVTGDFGLRFYAGAPLITHDGFLIGTLCIIDSKPRIFSEKDRSILEGLAKVAMDQIELRRSSLVTIDQLTDSNHELSKSFSLTVSLNEELNASRQRLQTFISKAPVAFGILTGRELTIEVANDMILKIWGKTVSVLGKPLLVALPELVGQPYLPILDEVFISGKTYIGDTAPVKLEVNDKLTDCYFDFIYEPLKNKNGETTSIIVIANDVTERIHKKKELEDLNQQLEIALNAGQLGSYHLDLITSEISCSKIFKSIYGLENDKAINFGILMNMILPEYRDELVKTVETSIAEKSTYHAEYQIKCPDDSIRWIHSSGTPFFDTNGKALTITGITVDITERKSYDAQKDDFLGIASHEFKTPLTSLKATIQLMMRLKEKNNHEMIPRLIDQSAHSLNKLTSLVDDLLNMHRISEGQLKLEKTKFNIYRMLTNCCQYLNNDYKYEIIGDSELTIDADENRIEQVIINFLNNAVKYAPLSKKIILQFEQRKEKVKIAVTDFGDGIDSQVQPYLFDRYYRVNHEGKKYSGLGLGLFISSEIIKRHHGEIGVESSLGNGSTFWFNLPIN